MEFAYIITLAAFLVCFLAALVGLRLAVSELSSPVPGSSWRRDAFLPVLLVSFTAFALLFTFANRTYDQIFPLTWVDLLLAFVSAAAVYAVSLFKKTDRIFRTGKRPFGCRPVTRHNHFVNTDRCQTHVDIDHRTVVYLSLIHI